MAFIPGSCFSVKATPIIFEFLRLPHQPIIGTSGVLSSCVIIDPNSSLCSSNIFTLEIISLTALATSATSSWFVKISIFLRFDTSSALQALANCMIGRYILEEIRNTIANPVTPTLTATIDICNSSWLRLVLPDNNDEYGFS